MLQATGAAIAGESGKCNAGLFDAFCEAGKSVLSKAGEFFTAPVRAAAGGVVGTITSWVGDGAQWVLSRVVSFLDQSTSPTLGASWFADRYHFMVGLGALVLLPLLLIATVRAIVNQDPGQLLRSYFVHLPVAILTTFVAVFFTRSFLSLTDAMSSSVAHGIAGDVSQIFDEVKRGLGGGATTGAPSFAIFFGALFIIIGSFFVWLELLVRSAAVTVSVFFLPLVLAGLVWPATARWTRRLLETLVALILSKFVIVSVISLATAALADPGGGGFGAVMGGAALMLMAAFSPMALLKLMPLAEGAAIGHLEGTGHKPLSSMGPSGGVHHALSIMRSKVDGGPSQSRSDTATATSLSSLQGLPSAQRARRDGTDARPRQAARGTRATTKDDNKPSPGKRADEVSREPIEPPIKRD